MRCKMKLMQLTHNAGGGTSLKFSPVMGDNPENKAFFKWTPSGEINLYVLNEEAVKDAKLGGEYYVDFTLAQPAAG